MGIDWVIVGGESGPGARPIEADWVREVRDQCVSAGVAFFFKQWGGLRPKSGGRELDGREWNEWPALQTAPVLIAAE
jgi:protein gp37